MRVGKLTAVSQGTALGRMSIRCITQRGSKFENRKYKIPNPPYIEKMLCLNVLVCFKCMEQIKIGEDYTRGGSSGGDGKYTKYYHSSCYERMFY